MTPRGSPCRADRRSPVSGVPVKSGRLILEAGDRWGDERSFTAAWEGDGLGRDVEDSLGPDVRACLEARALLRHL